MAWRNLINDRLYAIINILGLSLSTAVFLLIVNFVRYEYSYEDFHKKANNIYRVTYDLYKGAKYITTDCETHPPLGPLLKKSFPEVIDYVRIQDMNGQHEIKYNDQIYRVDKTYAADPSIFKVFSYDLVEGNKLNALEGPMKAVLTASQCSRIFGTAHAVGKSLRIGKYLYTISGVLKDPPANTHLKVDMLLSFGSLTSLGWDMNSWGGNNNFLYLQLEPNADLAKFNQKLKALSKTILQGKISAGNVFVAEPIKRIHLYSHKSYEPEVNGDAKSVKFMLVSAILILLVGSVNYVNLTTARSAKRIKETGMRKLLGSSRSMLVGQFMVETVVVNFLALLFSLVIVRIALPFYLELIGRPGDITFFSAAFWLTGGGLLIFNCLLSGIYPAVTISATKPIQVISRAFTGSRQSELFRKALVVGQFATAMIVLSASFIAFEQLSFMRKQNLGLNSAQVLILKAPMADDNVSSNQQASAFKNALQQLTGVADITIAEALPGVSQQEINSSNSFSRFGSQEGMGYNFYSYGIDARFLSTMEIKLAAGQNFSEGSANKDEVIINESAARLFGFNNAAAAVGQRLKMQSDTRVIGVIKDYHQLSMKEAILPMIHYYQESGGYFALKLQPGNAENILTQVQAIWKAHYPGYALDYHFMNDMLDQQYKSEQRFGKIVAVFSFLTLFITCLGILGLTAYHIHVRTREIGIRKVLGASVTSIVQMLSADMVKLIWLAVLLATPVAWYVMNLWLNDFTYRITIQWWIFAGTGLIAMVIALITLSFQSIKAAVMKPVIALKAEAAR